MMVPAAAAWIGVPVFTPMSIPSWWVPQRLPNGDVIGPLSGQLRRVPTFLGGLVVVGARVVGAWVGGASAGVRAPVGTGRAVVAGVVGGGAADSPAPSSPPDPAPVGGAGVARSRMISASW